jgi:hypothetical protein
LQEEVEMRAVTLIISSTKLSGRVLKSAIAKLMREIEKGQSKHRQRKTEKAATIPHGKQTVKQLVGQNAGVANIEVTDQNIKSFDRVARKYGVDYAVKKARSVSPPKYLVFFKARDADALTAAFKEYSAKAIKREAERPSVLAQLRKFTELVRGLGRDKVKVKEKGLEL